MFYQNKEYYSTYKSATKELLDLNPTQIIEQVVRYEFFYITKHTDYPFIYHTFYCDKDDEILAKKKISVKLHEIAEIKS